MMVMSVVLMVLGCLTVVLLKHPAMFIHSGAEVVTLTVLICLSIVSIGGFNS